MSRESEKHQYIVPPLISVGGADGLELVYRSRQTLKPVVVSD
jgi:hypothetical protein